MVQQIDIDIPPFLQKIGFKYYISIFLLFSSMIIYQLTGSIQLVCCVQIWSLIIAYYLPNIENYGPKYSKYHNSHNYHVIPVIMHCIGSMIFIGYSWQKYDEICISEGNTIAFITVYALSLSGNIISCHQLLHRNNKYCTIISYISLAMHQFTFYRVQHLYVHHKYVGSNQDPITAPKNMSVYRYIVRALFSTFTANYNYSISLLLLCILLNLCYIGILCLAAYFEGLSFQAGFEKVFFFLKMCYLELIIMQTGEYLMHYGLICRSVDEPVNSLCSWNCDRNLILSWSSFNVWNHSDHHMNSYKAYPSLEIKQKQPILPFDLLGGVFISFIPPLWFVLMNPYVDEVIQGKKVTQNHRLFTKLLTDLMIIVVLGYYAYSAVDSFIQ